MHINNFEKANWIGKRLETPVSLQLDNEEKSCLMPGGMISKKLQIPNGKEELSKEGNEKSA